jgi:hypothetical protein
MHEGQMQRSGMGSRNVVHLRHGNTVRSLGSDQTDLCKSDIANSVLSPNHAKAGGTLAIPGSLLPQTPPAPGVARHPHVWMISVVEDLINYCDSNGLNLTATSLRYLKADTFDELVGEASAVDSRPVFDIWAGESTAATLAASQPYSFNTSSKVMAGE